MKSMSIKTTVMLSALGLGGLALVESGVGFVGAHQISERLNYVTDNTVPSLIAITNIRGAVRSTGGLLGQHILAPTREATVTIDEELERHIATVDQALADYQTFLTDEHERGLYDDVMQAWSAWKATLPELRRESLAISTPAATAVLNGAQQSAITTLNATIDEQRQYKVDLAAQQKQAGADAVGQTQLMMSALCLFALIAAAGVVFLLRRRVLTPLASMVVAIDAMRQGDFSRRAEVERDDELGALAAGFNRMADELTTLVGEVQKSGIQVSTSMTEMAATSKQQQATATEIAATTTEVGATSKEISATSKELLRTIHEVSTVAEQTASLAVNGQAGVSSMEETMRQVTEAASTINAKLGVLNEKAGNINQVVITITKVADQTNLLSLNAAIEAEKAGEYGRGFAVVATEIRRLADQTGVATYDIEQMIKEIQSAISASVMGMDKFSEEVRRGMSHVQQVGGQLSEIVRQVQALVPHFELVSEGMQGQATGAEQISEALLQLTEAAQQTVQSLRQSTESIGDLNQVTGNLRSSVSRFKLSA